MSNRYSINGHEIDFNKCDWDVAPPPIGDELRTFLHLWLMKAFEAHLAQTYFPIAINWAIRRRSMEVLNWLDASTDPLDYEVAKAIRRIGTMDRRRYFGFNSGMFASRCYGFLARELGNKTWDSRNNLQDYMGKAAQEYYLRYGELPYFV